MEYYFSTYIAGTSQIVRQIIKQQISDLKIDFLLDGLVAYKTAAPVSELVRLPFFNHTFELIHQTKISTANPIMQLILDITHQAISFPTISTSSFKISFFMKNEMVKVDPKLVAEIQNYISKQTGAVYDNLAETEYIFFIRQEGYGFVGQRLTQANSASSSVAQNKQLYYLMNFLSEPTEDDIYLNPFSDTGAIIKSRLRWPYQQIIGTEQDRLKHEQSIKDFPDDIKFIQTDFLKLTELLPLSINKVVTDPPASLYEKTNLPLPQFYHQVFKQLEQLMSPGGIVVIFSLEKQTVKEISLRFEKQFKLKTEYNLQFNSKSASIFVFTKVS